MGFFSKIFEGLKKTKDTAGFPPCLFSRLFDSKEIRHFLSTVTTQ